MRRTLVLVAAAFLLAACGSSRRDVPPWMRPAQKPRDEAFQGGPVAMLLQFDANHDGIVTRAEMVAGLKAQFAAADKKHTGCLDAAEADVINQKRQDVDRSTATPLIDWNRDGCIDYREFSAAPYSLFDQLDRNNDDKLTPKEMGKKPQKAGDTGQTGAQAPAGSRRPGSHRGEGRGAPPEAPAGDEGPGGPLPAVPN